MTDLTAITEEDPRWRRIVTRHATADDAFVYAVKTTGVYCKPSCPSRTAKPSNVTFYDTPAEAEAAGYRACRRCNPGRQSGVKSTVAIIAQACRLIEAAEELPKLESLAAQVGLSPYYLHRQFKLVTGLTPKQWAAAFRMRKLQTGLTAAASSITSVLYDAGFNANSRFYEQSNRILGMTPTDFRNGGKGADIRFAVGQCSLGAILVAQSNKGICAITLGDAPDTLVRELQDRFHKANLIGDDTQFETCVAQVIGFVEAPRIGLNLPLDLRGTAFQQRVWQALRLVPAGATVSYADLARSLGMPKAARAVARACAANPIAVAIPCHRVVRNDGSLSGYRWGVERKQALIDKEARAKTR